MLEGRRTIQRFQKVLDENPALARYIQKLEKEAVKDSLTGLFNSNQFKPFLKREFEMAKRYNRAVSLILVDIDNFKSYNDKYGHVEGDKVIRNIGRVMKRKIRGTDYVFRYGYGEEFAIILPSTDLKGARQVAERIRRTIENQKFREKVTVSMGVATYLPPREMDYLGLLKLADAQLYRAKQEGKNKVCAFSG